MAGIRGKVVPNISKLVSSRNTGATFPDLWGFFLVVVVILFVFMKSFDFLILV